MLTMSTAGRISKFVCESIEKIQLGPGSTVLDAPCGLGRHAHWLASRGYMVSGADIDSARLKRARATAPPTEHAIGWSRVDLEQPWTHRQQFNALVMVHYYSPAVVTRAIELLRPGGFFVFETYGGQGQNYRTLPLRNTFYESLLHNFDIINYDERPVGPLKATAVVKAIAKKNRGGAH